MDTPSDLVRPSVRPGHEYHLAALVEHVWCPLCAFPSAVEARMVFVARRDPTRWLGEVIQFYCRDCGDTRYASTST